MTTKQDRVKAIEEDLAILDAMVVSLVELLERKGIVTQNEWDSMVKAKLAEGARLREMSRPRQQI